MRIHYCALLGIMLTSINGVATGAASASATINNTAGAVVGDTATTAPGVHSGSRVQFAANKENVTRLKSTEFIGRAKRRSTKQKEPASNLGSNQQPVLCDCSNCSAEHCRSRGVIEPVWSVEEGE